MAVEYNKLNENLPKRVKIVEVGPRDGLQNEKNRVATEDKIHFIELLMRSGLKAIEATSFVRSDRIPQLSDASEVIRGFFEQDHSHTTALSALVPNLKGLEEALGVGVKEIAVFTSTSNSFNQKNIHTDIKGSIERLTPVVQRALDEKLKVRGYVSTVFGCPYEGKTSIGTLLEVVGRLQDMGVYEVSLGDTIGVAHPLQVVEVIESLVKHYPLSFLAMHFHDTKKIAVANVLASLQCGLSTFDSSAGGLGGCPYAKSASGNIATEDLLHLLHSMGIETGVDVEKLKVASSFILTKLGKLSAMDDHCHWRCS